MSRLLHAAARGARIQVFASDMWYGASLIYLKGERRLLRIHPKDEHMQYGPISSAMRELALKRTRVTNSMYGAIAWTIVFYERNAPVYGDDFDTYVLLLAESLADEGL